ncbi:hypothetical protein, partial [Nocardia asiatica]|uniref:hypothetical protein n=1 Tax=Nocardia asiatica TaxID=209252 RepID=UPI003CC7E1A0
IEGVGAIGASALPSAAGLGERARTANQFQSGLGAGGDPRGRVRPGGGGGEPGGAPGGGRGGAGGPPRPPPRPPPPPPPPPRAG